MKETIHHVKASTQYKREHKADYGHEKIQILYEDNDIVVLNKPSGILSVPYPGSKARTVLEVLEKIMRNKKTLNANHKPLTVHRLDRDTSGVMMFALNEKAQKKIMATWHKMVTERLYRAVAENPKDKSKVLQDSGVIDKPLAQNAYHVGYVVHDKNDKAQTVKARTNYKVVLRGTTHTLFELSLDTGKKNQIRAHLASCGYPLAGDENYRAKTDPFNRLALHARTLAFVHPTTGKQMRFEVAEDAYWQEYVQKGDSKPKEPIWQKATTKSFANKQNTNLSAKDFAPQKRLSRKVVSKMDYIQRNKV